jgi:transcriptional regulator with XRE-family HTH domain
MLLMADEREAKRETIRRNLIHFRVELDLSQEAAAQLSGIPLDNYRRYEQGKRKIDTVELSRLAAVFGRRVDDFLDENPQPLADKSIVPPFLLKTVPGVEVDRDLQDEMKRTLDRITDEHRRRLRERKQRR